MAKKRKMLMRPTIVLIGLALGSFFALQVFNKMTNPELEISLNASGIGDAVVDVLVDIVRSLINPERRS